MYKKDVGTHQDFKSMDSNDGAHSWNVISCVALYRLDDALASERVSFAGIQKVTRSISQDFVAEKIA